MGWIETYSGRKVTPWALLPADVDVRDVAHALSLQCRFNGHCPSFYSVAQHCVLVSLLVPPEDALWGLLHDASEAYLSDIPSPVKRSPAFTEYRLLERAVMRAVVDAFSLPWPEPSTVHLADRRILLSEQRDLLKSFPPWYTDCYPYPEPVTPGWRPKYAERRFLARFKELRR